MPEPALFSRTDNDLTFAVQIGDEQRTYTASKDGRREPGG